MRATGRRRTSILASCNDSRVTTGLFSTACVEERGSTFAFSPHNAPRRGQERLHIQLGVVADVFAQGVKSDVQTIQVPNLRRGLTMLEGGQHVFQRLANGFDLGQADRPGRALEAVGLSVDGLQGLCVGSARGLLSVTRPSAMALRCSMPSTRNISSSSCIQDASMGGIRRGSPC